MCSVQYGRACPSLNDGLARNPYGWEAFLIRRFKIQSANRNEIKRRAGRCDPFRPGKGMGNRNAHVWRAKLSQGGVIAKFHQGTNDRLRMHHDGNAVDDDRKEEVGFNKFQALVHHTCTINAAIREYGDRMTERVTTSN